MGKKNTNNNNHMARSKSVSSYNDGLPNSAPFCVWLGNLPAEATSSDIVKYLEPLKIEPRDIRFGRVHKKGSYRCAYVDFYNKEDMRLALQSISSPEAPLFMGRVVEIDINEGIAAKQQSNGSFRSNSNNPVTSKQDVRSFENKQSTKETKQKQQKQQSSPPQIQQPAIKQSTNNNNDRFQQSNVRGRGRGRDRGRRGRRSDYFRGQYPRYKQKTDNYRSSFSNPSFSDNLPQQKPVKILKRPKESTVPIISPKSNANMNGAHNHKRSNSLPVSPHNVNKSRFPTMAEDKTNKVRINPMLKEYINESVMHKNEALNNINHYTQQKKKHYHNEHDSYYYNKAKQRHNGTVQNQQYHQHGSYKQKRHRNNHRKSAATAT